MGFQRVLRELADAGASALLQGSEEKDKRALRLVCRSARDFVDLNIRTARFDLWKKHIERARAASTPSPILSRWPNCSSVSICLEGERYPSEDVVLGLTLPFIGLSSACCKKFTKLVVQVWDSRITAHAVSLLVLKMPALRTLKLQSFQGVADNGLQLLMMYDAIAGLPHLQTLSLPHTGAPKHLSKLSDCSNLRQLRIEYPCDESTPLDVGSLLQGLSSLTSLRTLEFREVAFQEDADDSQAGQAGGGEGGGKGAQLQALLGGLPTGIEELRLVDISEWETSVAFSLEQRQLLEVKVSPAANGTRYSMSLSMDRLLAMARQVLLPLLRPRCKLRRLILGLEFYSAEVLDDGDMAVLRELVSRCEEAPRMPSLVLPLPYSDTVEAQVRAAEQAIELLGRPRQLELQLRLFQEHLYSATLDLRLSAQQVSSGPPQQQPLPSAAGLLVMATEAAAAQPQRPGWTFLLCGSDITRLFGKGPLPGSDEPIGREPESAGAGDGRADLGGPSPAGEVPGQAFMRSLLQHLDKHGASALVSLHFTLLQGAEPSVLMVLRINWNLAREGGTQDRWLAKEVAEAARAAAAEVSGQGGGPIGAEDARPPTLICNQMDDLKDFRWSVIEGIQGRVQKALQAVWDRDFSATNRGRQPLTAELIPWLLRVREELQVPLVKLQRE